MKKVTTMSRINETNAVAIRIIDLYKTFNRLSSDTHLQQLIDTLTAKSTQLTQAINQQKSESALADSDQVVNDRVRNLFNLVSGYTHHPDSMVQQAALSIDKVLQAYGLSMINESYATQTSLVDALLADLTIAENAAQIKSLSGCETVITQLQEAQTAFKQECIKYESKKTAESNQPVATNLKREVLQLINQQLIVHLQAMKQVNPSLYSSFADTVEQFITDNNRMIDKRNHKNVQTTVAPTV